MKKFTVWISILALVSWLGCSSKKTVEKDSKDVNASAATDNTPISFDPSGSDSGKIFGLSTIHFGYDASKLDAKAKEELSRNADWIKSHPRIQIQIEGHCDSRGSIEYNLALGERRAQAAMKYLMGLGVPQDRLSTISYGKEKPIAAGDDEAAWTKNRRDNFVASGR